MTVLLFAATEQAGASSGILGPSTPIVVAAGATLVANADGPPDLLGALTAQLTLPDGTVIVAANQVTITVDSQLSDSVWRYAARLTAPDTADSYLIAWTLSDPPATASEPVTVEIGSRPSVASVAALIRARTKVKGGAELGTFNDAGPPNGTRPTATEVEYLIDAASDEVGGKVQPVDDTLPPGSPLGPGSAYERRYRSTVALYAAILIELSYFPEQVRNNQSPVSTLQQLYDSRIRALISEGEVGRPGGMGEGAAGAGDAPADAAWSFPDALSGALIGWGSRW